MFIGSEGTLGIITKVALQVYPLCRPEHREVAIVPVKRFDDAISLLTSSREHLGRSLSAFEYMDRASIKSVDEIYPELTHKLRSALGDNPAFVLIETSSSSLEEPL
jgi:D-2-hydroxyglutarate dehydrogenase